MSPRRMDISSLLCQDDSAQNEQNTEPLLSQRPLSPPLNDPVILAPHLRGRHVHHQPHPPTATSMTTHKHTTDHPQVLSLTLQPPPTLQHTPSTNTDYPPSSSTKHLHMSQHNSEHADLTSEFPRHPPSSPLTSPAYTERPRTIDALLHHPPGYSRPPPPSQISPTDHYSRPSSSHSPTSAISILNHLPQYSPGSQSPLSSIASYSPTASRDTRQDTISLNTNVSPIHSTHRPIESPIATYKSSRPIPTSRPSPLTLPHTFSRSTPDVLQSSQHRVLSSTFSHPYSPTEMAQQRHASNPNHMAASTSPSAPAPPLAHITPPSAPASAQGKQRSPFLALEALVHVASEERRRISGGSDVSGTGTGGGLNHERGLEREDEFSRGREMELERENEDYAYAHGSTNTNPSLVHDREKPSGSTRHYGYPTIHVPVTASYSAAAGMHSYPQPQPQPQPYSRSHRNSYSSQTSPLHHPPSTSFEDEARPHKRHRESRSPSPSRSRSRSPNARTVAEIRSTDYQSPASTYVTVRRHAHQPYRHVESSGLLVSIPPTPGMLVGGGNNVRVVGPALVAAPFLPPSRSYTTSAPLQHASPRASSYVQPHHPVQVPSPSHHSFPHNQSPQHSPKHPRPQLHHPQSQTALPHSAVHLPTTAESVPPSYGYGPKMAGGVGVLMHDSPPRRNVPKRDLSPGDAARYEGLRHEASREQLKYESMSQQGRYEPSKHVPLQAPVPRLARAVWDNESGRMDEMEVQAPRDNVVCREGVVVPQEQLQLRHPQPPPSPHVHVERPRKRKSEEHVKEVGVSSESLPLPQYRPLRVWEERLPAPEAPQGVSPTPVLYAVNNQVADNISEGCVQQELLGENKREHGEQPAVEDQVNESREEVVDKCVSPPPPSPMRSVSPSLAPVTTRSPTPPVHHACIEPCSPLLLPGAQMAFVASASQSEISHPSLARISYEPRPFLSPAPAQSPLSIKSEPQAPASPPASPAPAPPASPIRDLQSEHLEPELELGHSNTVTSRSRSRSTHTPPPESEPSWSEVEPVPEAVIMHDTIMSDALIQDPSSELAQPPTLAQEPEPLGTPEIRFKLERSPSKSQSRSPSQVPLSIPPPIKKEPNILPEGIPITIPNHSEPSLRRSPKPERSPERPQAVTGSSMMDVDEELLSLVEDRVPASAPALPAKLTSQAKSKSASPFMVGRGAGAGAEQGSSTSADGSSTSASSQLVPKVPAIIADDEKDRESMPPPAPRTKKEKAEKVEKDRGALAAGTAVRSKKKMDGISKIPAKPKQPGKARIKPAAKTKAKSGATDTSVRDSSTKGGLAPKGGQNAGARSRSTSAMPGGVDDVVADADADDSEKEDGKFYCVCKTRYDEDEVMIACDRCDEWYHTQCVDVPDPEIDLVDQFICPPCVQKYPHLQTTWKRRCLFGLKHENPSSPSACHKPSRGTFSKYCSDECGIKYMQSRISQWERSGGTRDLLWDSVKSAEKREGVVVRVGTTGVTPHIEMDIDDDISSTLEQERDPPPTAAKRRPEREIAHLNARLEQVVKEREMMKREMDMVFWREKVVELASERAEKVDECGWDQRLCFGEEEWADFGTEVVESFEEERANTGPGDDTMQVDSATTSHGEWWCTGKKKCERHAGWQKLRAAEVSFDKETKEGILLKLTTREREIRKGIEDILYPQAHTTSQVPSKPSHPEVELNGASKSRSRNGDLLESGGKKS